MFSATNPPPLELIQAVCTAFGSGLQPGTKALKSKNPKEVLGSVREVNQFAKRAPGGRNVILGELLAYLLGNGCLIHSNDKKKPYLFDADQCREVLGAIRTRTKPTVPETFRRIHRLLGLSVPKAGKSAAATPKPAAAPAVTAKPAAEPKPEPEAEHVEAKESVSSVPPTAIRGFVTEAVTKRLNGLAEDHPPLKDLCKQLGVLAVQSTRGHVLELDNTILAISLSVKALQRDIEDAAIETLQDLQTELEGRLADSRKGKPEAEHQNPRDWLRAQAAALREEAKPLEDLYRRLLDVQSDATTILQEIEIGVIENVLEEHLRIAKSEDEDKIHGAITLANAAIDGLRDYLAAVSEIIAPIKSRIDDLSRRATAASFLLRPLEDVKIEAPVLPAMPEVDLEALKDWEAVAVPEPDLPAQTGPESAQIGTVASQPMDLTPTVGEEDRVKLTEDMVLAVFAFMGRRTSFKVAKELWKLGFGATEFKIVLGFVYGVCKKYRALKDDETEADRPDPTAPVYLVGAGTMRVPGHIFPMYKVTNEYPLSNVDKILSDELKRALKKAFEFKKKK
jgi:hypothetical protein